MSVVCPGFVEARMTAVNDFPMPFLMPVQKAAEVIALGLARDKGRIAFPFGTFWGVRFLAMLPEGLAQIIVSKSPAKSG